MSRVFQDPVFSTRQTFTDDPGHLRDNLTSILRCQGIPANTRRWPNADLMLGHRLRRWPSIKSALGQRIVFAEKRYTDLANTRCWHIGLYPIVSTRRGPYDALMFNGLDAGPALTQNRVNVHAADETRVE